MRLLNTKTLQFEEWQSADLPSYAILSHTWGNDEISLQEMRSPTRQSYRKSGYIKIKAACALAFKESFAYIWIDTCCIDKSSSAELSEAINSMFAWYAKSSKCYAYLSDINWDSADQARKEVKSSRWFTRGWTLQELLAPSRLEFYDVNWTHLGSPLERLNEISNCTGISIRVLSRNQSLRDCSVAMKMSWAVTRQTTRVEDMAYCLLGIFDINMPMLYGEGPKAFRRLQEEIVKKENDMTIFAWKNSACNNFNYQSPIPLLAPSIDGFAAQSWVSPFASDFYSFTLTNKGLFVPGELVLKIMTAKQALSRVNDAPTSMYVLWLGYDDEKSRITCGVCLRKVGPGLFYRDGRFDLFKFSKDEKSRNCSVNDCYILHDPLRTIKSLGAQFRQGCIRVPPQNSWTLEAVSPEDRWDATDSMFVKSSLNASSSDSTVFALRFKNFLARHLSDIVVLCDYVEDTPCAKVFLVNEYNKETLFLFNQKNRRSSVSWPDLESQFPGSQAWKKENATELTNVTLVKLEKGSFNHEVQSIDVFNLSITMTPPSWLRGLPRPSSPDKDISGIFSVFTPGQTRSKR